LNPLDLTAMPFERSREARDMCPSAGPGAGMVERARRGREGPARGRVCATEADEIEKWATSFSSSRDATTGHVWFRRRPRERSGRSRALHSRARASARCARRDRLGSPPASLLPRHAPRPPRRLGARRVAARPRRSG
jgi:hypothetical protein